MGLFDKLFGKKQEKPEKKVEYTLEYKAMQDKITRKLLEDGSLSCDLLNGKTNTSTSVIVNPKPIVVKNMPIYELAIEWYGDESDTFYIDTNSHSRVGGKETIYAGLDLNQLQNNDEYLKFALEQLLEEDRVNRYLTMAMKTEEEINNEVARTGNRNIYPCGRYVGSVQQTDKGLAKRFDKNIGRMFHNMPQMRKEREEFRAKKEAKKQNRIAMKRKEIDRLSREIEDEENARY